MPKRGRPRTHDEEREQTSLRIPRSLWKRAHHAAIDRDVSMNFLVCKALDSYLDRLPPIDADRACRSRRRRARRERLLRQPPLPGRLGVMPFPYDVFVGGVGNPYRTMDCGKCPACELNRALRKVRGAP